MSFDAHDVGTAATDWRADPRWSGLPELSLRGIRSLTVIAAHPDDETLGCAGLMARCTELGIGIRVVVVTDGAASHPSSPTHSPSRLRSLRESELRAAVYEVAPRAEIEWLGFPDGRTDAVREQVEQRLASTLLFLDSAALVVAPWSGDGHRDHRIVGEVVARAAAHGGATVLGYPIWMWHWATPDDSRTPWAQMSVLPLDADAAARKSAAIDSFRSQLEPLSDLDGDERMLEPAVVAHFRTDREIYIAAPVAVVAAATTDTVTDADTGTAPAPLPREYFERLYERRDDPWRFLTRWYERRKRGLTLAALPEPHYAAALELGCSIGVLSAELAERVDRLVAVDISQRAVDVAREALRARDNVTVERADVAEGLPDGRFDLILVSEVGYYLDAESLARLGAEIREHLAVGGDVVLCHWRPDVDDYPLDGAETHRILTETMGLARLSRYEDADLLLEVFCTDERSVAQREGLR